MRASTRGMGVHLRTLALVAVFFGVGGCISSSEKGGNQILGRLAAGLRQTGQSASALQPGSLYSALVKATGASKIDRICGMPVARGKVNVMPGDLLSDMYCVEVSPDGSFSIPVGNVENDWVYVLVDSTQPKQHQVVGFVGPQDIQASGAMLLSWPASAQTKDADVGTVSADTGGEITSSATVADVQQSFLLTVDQLDTLARNSQLMRAFRNDFIDYDPATKQYYSMGPSYQWDVGIDTSVGEWSPLPTADNYRGYGIIVYHNDRTMNATAVCKGGPVALSVVPPAPVTVVLKDSTTVTFSADNPVTNAGISAIDSRGWCGDEASGSHLGASGTGEPPYVMGFFSDLKQNVSGDWIIKKNGTAVAWCDAGMTAPFVDGDPAKPIRVPVPRARVTLDADRKLTKLEISWWMYDATAATYVEVTDLTAIQRLFGGGYSVGINDDNMKKDEKLLSFNPKDPDEPMTSTFTSFANPWRVPTTPNTGETPIRDIRIMYTIARTSLTVNLTSL